MLSLVDYSSSESDSDVDDTATPIASNDNNKLPFKLQVDKPLEDDPSRHEGRERTIKHERGIWATFIYISADNIKDTVLQIQTKLQAELSNLDLKSIPEPHISLSRLLILRHHWIEQFVSEVSLAVIDEKKFRLFFQNEFEFYLNEERTRTFVGLKVEHPVLLNLVGKLNPILSSFNLPHFYDNPSFHCSILWCLGDRIDSLKQTKKCLQNALNDIFEEEQGYLQIQVNELLTKCGNRKYEFSLR